MRRSRKIMLIGCAAVLLVALAAAGYAFHRHAVAAAEERRRAEAARQAELLRQRVASPEYRQERQLALRRIKEREAKARKNLKNAQYRKLPEPARDRDNAGEVR